MKKGNYFIISCVFVLFLICGCGGENAQNDGNLNPPDPQSQDVNMSGQWKGNMLTKEFGDSELAFELEQNGSNLSGKMVFEGVGTNDVSGSVDNAIVYISGIYPVIDTGEKLEFAFQLS